MAVVCAGKACCNACHLPVGSAVACSKGLAPRALKHYHCMLAGVLQLRASVSHGSQHSSTCLGLDKKQQANAQIRRTSY